MAVTNAQVIYKMNKATSLQKVQTNRQFHLSLAESLVIGLVQCQRGPGHIVSTRLSGKHFLYRSGIKRRCHVCAYKKHPLGAKKYKETKVTTWCPQCEGDWH